MEFTPFLIINIQLPDIFNTFKCVYGVQKQYYDLLITQGKHYQMTYILDELMVFYVFFNTELNNRINI